MILIRALCCCISSGYDRDIAEIAALHSAIMVEANATTFQPRVCSSQQLCVCGDFERCIADCARKSSSGGRSSATITCSALLLLTPIASAVPVVSTIVQSRYLIPWSCIDSTSPGEVKDFSGASAKSLMHGGR